VASAWQTGSHSAFSPIDWTSELYCFEVLLHGDQPSALFRGTAHPHAALAEELTRPVGRVRPEASISLVPSGDLSPPVTWSKGKLIGQPGYSAAPSERTGSQITTPMWYRVWPSILAA